MIAFGLLALVAVSGVISASVPFHFLSDEYIDHINSLQTTWKAGRNFPKDMPLSNIKRRMGVIRGEKSKNLKTVRHVRVEGETIPDTFDARENWPDCKSIGLIRDQSDCGSCWAVAAAAAMSDRICILSKGKDQSLVSDEDLNSCCKSCGDCDGGIPYAAWEYWQQTGIVTGVSHELSEFIHVPWQYPHMAAQFSPAFLHPLEEVHPFLQLHDINLSNESKPADHVESWQEFSHFPKDMPLSHIKRRLGALEIENQANLQTVHHVKADDEVIPDTFDAREKWPNCESIRLIRDQSECGSGWGCKAYSLPPCEHYGTTGGLPQCPSEGYYTPDCVGSCDKGYTLSYNDSKTYAAQAYTIIGNVEQIQLEILRNGPVAAIFTMNSDFLNYKSGVYQDISLDYFGTHAVRVIGWGEENNVPFWLITNSWNEDWGDKGTFKIRRGTNECRIENQVSAGLPRL
ncbi:unnamed protein product [Phaedon cochleariae]|uniref:Peptidase C1A papain C-terminal domain-containing protein n=1 Tax=Phaedon cochleariae TaxID=80249 RepID=A0A9N9SIP3_PHACE|nr:unnamed protein product [Phaedon cochleariae]